VCSQPKSTKTSKVIVASEQLGHRYRSAADKLKVRPSGRFTSIKGYRLREQRNFPLEGTGVLSRGARYRPWVHVDVIVLNGGSSSGKSSLAVCLQKRLAGTWLTLGIDDLIRALSHGPTDTTAGGTLEFRTDGSIAVAQEFRTAEASWYEALATIAHAGTGVIVDEVFLDGGVSQARLQKALDGLAVVWIGVRCHPATAEARELQRQDRVKGLARDQAERVHEGVSYDIVVDTTDAAPDECATLIVATLKES
jgi:chloramphenicol 3-O phosphotransferase